MYQPLCSKSSQDIFHYAGELLCKKLYFNAIVGHEKALAEFSSVSTFSALSLLRHLGL
jgi:hypothetical protein